MTMWRSERSMKQTGRRPWAEGACRGVVTRMAIDAVRRWMAMRRKVAISVGRMRSISIGRTGARCGSGTPGSRSWTCDGMTRGEVRGTIINLGFVQSGLGGLLDVLKVNIQPTEDSLLAVNLEEESPGLRDGVEWLTLTLSVAAIVVALGHGRRRVGNTALNRLLLLGRTASRIVLVSTILPRTDGASTRTLGDGSGRCAIGSAGKPDVYRAPRELVVQLLLAAVGPGVVLLLARGADGSRRGDLFLLADGLVEVEGDGVEGTVDDATGLDVNTGLVEGDANIG